MIFWLALWVVHFRFPHLFCGPRYPVDRILNTRPSQSQICLHFISHCSVWLAQEQCERWHTTTVWRTIYTWYVSFRADNMLDTVRLEQVWTLLPRARILVTNLVNWDICYGIGFDMDGPSNNMAIGGLWHRPETGCNGGEVDHWIRCKCQWQNFGAEYVINVWQTFYSTRPWPAFGRRA